MFERVYRPWYLIVLAVILFPIGLIGLFFPSTAVFTVNISESPEGSTILFLGDADGNIVEAVNRMTL
jgi:hypothetical protein